MESIDLATEVDAQLTRYQDLTNQIDALEEQIRSQLKTYDELLQSYQTALKIIMPRMKAWSHFRYNKVKDISKQILRKWDNGSTNPKGDKLLEQENQLFQTIINIHFRKHAVSKEFQDKRVQLLKQQVAKLRVFT